MIAGAVNFAAIPFPYLGPIVGLAVAGRSSFVRYHASRCLIEQVLATAILVVVVGVSLAYSVWNLVQSGVFENGIQLSKIDWLGILIKSVVTWIALALWNLWNLLNSLRDGMSALAGQEVNAVSWSERRAARFAGIAPAGSLPGHAS